jgi:hypothetical protein
VIQVVATLDSSDQPHVEFRHLAQGLEDGAVAHQLEDGRAGVRHQQAPYHFAVDGASFEIICNHFRADLLPYLVVKASSVVPLAPSYLSSVTDLLLYSGSGYEPPRKTESGCGKATKTS